MVDAWMPGARCIRAKTDGGTLRGGAPRVVWQALGADPRLISASSAAQCLVQDGRPPHLVWNPLSGDIVQLIPVVRAACSLGGPEGLGYQADGYGTGDYGTGDYGTGGSGTGGSGTGGPLAAPHPANREGRLCVQIGVVGRASEPFTDGPMHGVEPLLGWLASWGVPSRWPAGRPAPSLLARTGARSRARWALGGHFGASQVPGWDAVGPGHIYIDLLCPRSAVPRPVVSAGHRAVTLSHTREDALEAMLDREVGAGAAVPSLANAPY